MCGICGIFNFKTGKPVDAELLKRMTDSISHRGPDDEGRFIGDGIGFGVRRLSIIDIATGRQPIFNEDNSLAIGYNGEIYNYLELKEELEKKGHRFTTKSDTEVILHLYEELGERCLDKLNGMFAFIIWDKKTKTLFGARDRFGIKPFYYSMENGSFVFSSELHTILLTGVEKTIDYDALSEYFSFYYINAPRTIFRSIRKLPHSHFFTIKDGQFEVKRYWNLEYNIVRRKREEDYTEEIKTRLKNAIKRQFQSEVPVGVFLSGGMDSTSVVASAREFTGTDLKTFSLGFREKSYTELDEAREVAGIYGTDHNEQEVGPEVVRRNLPLYIRNLGEPHGDWSCTIYYAVAEFAKKKITVALSGEGGDEMFGGYPTCFSTIAARYLRFVPNGFANVQANMLKFMSASENRMSRDFILRTFLSGVGLPALRAHYKWKEIFSKEYKRILLRNSAREKISEMDSFNVFKGHLANAKSKDLLSKLFYLDANVFMIGCTNIMRDVTSMANSLEVRIPFLDNEVVDFASTIPPDEKVKIFAGSPPRPFVTKSILRRAMKGYLPEKILRMKKKGFILPGSGWIKRELKPFVLDLLSEDSVRRTGILNYNAVDGLLKEHFNNIKDNTRKITCLASFMMWHNIFIRN